MVLAPVFCLCLFSAGFTGCAGKGPLDPKKPVTLTMWHNFGGEMQRTMDVLIDEFNATVGKERGIIISVAAITASAELQASLTMILNGDPGAPAMPDITTAYPRTAVQFQSKGMLLNFDAYFSAQELAAYVPAFVEEGRLGDGGLYVFPFAKSTELLFVNQTLFDRFAVATGVTMDCFGLFEDIAATAALYYRWSGGKQFYTADSWINLAQAGMLQQGTGLFSGEKLSADNAAFRHIWDTCYAPAVTGGFAVYDGYSSDLAKTGDIVCSSGSSAGILFYGDTITYPDNTVVPVDYSILPFPVFSGGAKIAIQRGNGLMIAKSDPAREYAAALFVKWFTNPARNMRFVAGTGYLPVTGEAFTNYMPQTIASVENPRVRRMLEAVTKMYDEYDFFVAPAFETFDSLSRNYERQYRALLAGEREAYMAGAGRAGGTGALGMFIAGLNQ